jgi:hypothetical protein
MTRISSAATYVASVAAVITLIGVPAPLDAQSADPRWQPWVGCWVAAGGTERACVSPAAGRSAVDIVTTAGNGAVTRERIEANGEPQVSERDGCTGWERARWSADGLRVYLSSEYQCANGPTRRSSGLLVMSSRGRWLSVAGVTLGENTGVRVLRYDAAVSTAATLAARAAMASIDLAALIEASRQANPLVVEAWLGESEQAFSTNARRLGELADANVPERIIDILVALSYPNAFAIKPSPTTAGVLADDGALAGGLDEFSVPSSVAGCRPGTAPAIDAFGRLSLYGWDGCSMYYGYSPYARPPYLNSPYGRWYMGSQPNIIVLVPGAAAEHGRVIKGGYVEGSTGSTTGSTATPSGDGSGTSGNPGGTTTTTGTGSNSGGDRTARPR